MRIVAGVRKKRSEILGGPGGGRSGRGGRRKKGPKGVHPETAQNNVFFERNVKEIVKQLRPEKKEAQEKGKKIRKKNKRKTKEKQLRNKRETQNRTHKELFLVLSPVLFFLSSLRLFRPATGGGAVGAAPETREVRSA